jgi:hypothetical protein
MYNIVIPVYPNAFSETINKINILNDINNISISLISLREFFTSPKTSNEFISDIINKGKSKHPINQIWMDEIFSQYNIFPAICKDTTNIYKYFEVVKIFIPYIREIMFNSSEGIVYIDRDFTVNDIKNILSEKIPDISTQALILPCSNSDEMISKINEDFSSHKFNKAAWSSFKNNILPGNTSVILYNVKHFSKLLTETGESVNRNTFESMLNLLRFVEFSDYIDALISLCYNYNFITKYTIPIEEPHIKDEPEEIIEEPNTKEEPEIIEEPNIVTEEKPPQKLKKVSKTKMKK